MTGAADPELFVRSFARGIAVLQAFDADHPRLALAEAAERCGLSRAVTRRFLHTLVDMGYVGTDGSSFTLRPKVMELGHLYLSSLAVQDLAEPHMRALSGALRETVSMAVPDGADMIIVARIVPRRLMTVTVAIGTRVPGYCSALGRAAMSRLPDEQMQELVRGSTLRERGPSTSTDPDAIVEAVRKARRTGYAMVDEELEIGLRSIAMPMCGADGELVGAMNISTPSRRGSARSLIMDMLPKLQLAVHAVEGDLALLRAKSDPGR